MGFYETLEKGGALMIPIIALSVIALAIFLERLWALQARRTVPSGFCRALMGLIHEKDLSRAQVLCNENESAVSNVALAGLRHAKRPRGVIKEVMEEAGDGEIGEMERMTGVISTIATVSPLLGLLGTVTGMIKVFRDVSAHEDPQISVLAGGIWEALITTAAGLTVAIPAFAMHRYIMGRIDGIARQMAERSLEIIEGLDDPAQDEPATAAAE